MNFPWCEVGVRASVGSDSHRLDLFHRRLFILTCRDLAKQTHILGNAGDEPTEGRLFLSHGGSWQAEHVCSVMGGHDSTHRPRYGL